MERRMRNIGVLLAVLMAVLCFTAMRTVSARLDRLEREMGNSASVLEREIQNQRYQIERMLAEQASLLTGEYSISCETVDVENSQATVSVTLTPKTVSEGETAVLYINGTAVPMRAAQGAYTAQADLPLFTQSTLERVVFTHRGVHRTQTLEETLVPRERCLPFYYAEVLENEIRPNVKDGIVTLQMKSEVMVLGKDDEGSEAVIQVFVNGKQVDTVTSAPGMHRESILWDATYRIPVSGVLSAYAEVTDEYGLVHRVPVLRMLANEQGHLSGEMGGEASIYDADGRLLYSEPVE